MTTGLMTNQLPTGEQIVCKFINMFKTNLLHIEVNFNPYDHIAFAKNNICALPGVKMLTGAQANGKNKGQFSFLLARDFDMSELESDIKNEFENYFIKF